MRKKIDDYRGHEIFLDERTWMFRVEGEEFVADEGNEYAGNAFGSYEAAKAAIDRSITNRGKVDLKAVKVAIEVWSDTGEPMTIVGANRATGKVKVEGYAGNNRGVYDGEDVWPKVAWVGEMIRRRCRLQQEIMEMSETLSGLRVSVARSWDRQIPAERYAGHMKKIESEVAEAAAEALKEAK